MSLTRDHWLLLAFNLLYIAGFSAYFLSVGNYEFIWYIVVMVGLLLFLALTFKRSQLPLPILWALSFWGLLHMAGGGVRVGGQVLYAYVLIPIVVDGEMSIFKFDQFVHAYGFGVAALALLSIFRRWTHGTVGPRALAAAAILASMGLGAANEIVEFLAVVALPHTGVGGYFNTGLDLVFNSIGAILAAGGALLLVRLKRGR